MSEQKQPQLPHHYSDVDRPSTGLFLFFLIALLSIFLILLINPFGSW